MLPWRPDYYDPLSGRHTLKIPASYSYFNEGARASAASAGFNCKDSGGNTIEITPDRATCCQKHGVPGTGLCYGDPAPGGGTAGAGSPPTPSYLQFLDKLTFGGKIPSWALIVGGIIGVILLIIGLTRR